MSPVIDCKGYRMAKPRLIRVLITVAVVAVVTFVALVLQWLGFPDYAWAFIILVYSVGAIYWTLRLMRRKLHVVAILYYMASIAMIVFAFSRIYLGDVFVNGKGDQIEIDAVAAFYFSTVTWTTLGYGDLQPLDSMRLVAAWEAFFGYIYMGFFIAFAFYVFRDFIKGVSPHDSRSR